jgi:hypothetical protein
MDAKKMLGNWEEELKSRNPGVTTSASGDPLSFDSINKHETSGLDFHVRHKVVSMHWDPKDKRGKFEQQK